MGEFTILTGVWECDFASSQLKLCSTLFHPQLECDRQVEKVVNQLQEERLLDHKVRALTLQVKPAINRAMYGAGC